MDFTQLYDVTNYFEQFDCDPKTFVMTMDMSTPSDIRELIEEHQYNFAGSKDVWEYVIRKNHYEMFDAITDYIPIDGACVDLTAAYNYAKRLNRSKFIKKIDDLVAETNHAYHVVKQ